MVFYFWFMFIWIFITIVADIFRREDVGGWGKAGWLFLLVIFPFLGALIYMIARPKMTEQDKRIMAELEEKQRRMAGYSAADEIAKATELKNSGAITEAEFEEIKRRALAVESLFERHVARRSGIRQNHLGRGARGGRDSLVPRVGRSARGKEEGEHRQQHAEHDARAHTPRLPSSFGGQREQYRSMG
jgi:hypothetical protein